MKKRLIFSALLGGALALTTFAEEQLPEQLQILKEMGISPADVIVEEGYEYFHNLKGKTGKTCASCHQQDGQGLVGAYAKMPRYYEDIKRVADVDLRILSCMVKYMGFDKKELKGKKGRKYIVPLAGYVATLSNGMPINVEVKHPEEKRLYELGKELWYMRVGARDFSCAVCHEVLAGKRIRLQKLGAPVRDKLYAHWPAYRISKDKLWTMEDRIRGCYKSFFLFDPDKGKFDFKNNWVQKPPFYMEEIIALELYMKKAANGATLEVPGLIR
ncbi:MAG: sulfur oxidation c-type cytochrome SoxA [Aquificae bacterium]|nr:sulfur oxidation c-type cytochrome SoxA [Aquificota bacterium]